MSRRQMLLCASTLAATLLAAKSLNVPTGAGAAEHVVEPPVITRVIGRDFRITITSNPGGPRYSVTNAAGETLAANLTLDQLRAQRPDLYERIEPALSDADSDSLWAGIETD